jgi:hypothetical protein
MRQAGRVYSILHRRLQQQRVLVISGFSSELQPLLAFSGAERAPSWFCMRAPHASAGILIIDTSESSVPGNGVFSPLQNQASDTRLT